MRTLLVSYVAGDQEPVLQAKNRLSPVDHVELHDASVFSKSSHVRSAETILPGPDRGQILREAQAWLKALPSQPVKGRAFAEWLLHSGISVWWWIESPLWVGDPRDPACPPLPVLFENVAAVRAVLEEKSFDRVLFVSDVTTRAETAIIELSEEIGLEFVARSPRDRLKSMFVESLRSAAIRRVLLGRRGKSSRVTLEKVDALLVTHLNALRKVGGHVADVYLGPLGDALSTRKVAVASCYVNSRADANPLAESAIPELPPGGFLLEQAIGRGPALAASKSLTSVMRCWDSLYTHASAFLTWRRLPLRRTFGPWLRRLLRRHSPTAVYYLAAFGEIMESCDPRVIVVTNETGYAGRAAVVASRRQGRFSVGVQHGAIGPQHIEYLYPLEVLDSTRPWCCPIPDVTALDGRYYEGVLRELSGYPRESLVVTGQMRYEAYLRNSAPTERVSQRIVVATQPMPDVEGWLTATLEAVRDLGEIIIKIHPTERPETYRGYVARRGVTASVLEDADLHRLLSSANLLIARASTTIVEAALTGCPAVMFNPSGLPDPFPFVESGGALGARSSEELRACVKDVLEGGPRVVALTNSRRAFLDQFALGGGAGSASRLADEVARLLQRRSGITTP